jgi:hypothetical protein
VSPVRYELDFYIPEDGILHSHRYENLKSYIALTAWALQRRRNVSPVRYELCFYIPKYGILHSHRYENLKSYIALSSFIEYRTMKRVHNPLILKSSGSNFDFKRESNM